MTLRRSHDAQFEVSDAKPEARPSVPNPFKTLKGEAAYLAAYDAAMKSWSVPYRELNIPSRFGTTHVVVSGPNNAPPLVLLHGYVATLTMWAPNIADFSKTHRVYAIDVMGQPSKSIPTTPIRDARDYVTWLTEILDGLHLEHPSLVGMSYGGWLALNFAVAAPERVQRLVLLSPAASLLPLVRQFRLRGMPMVLLPTRLTVISFMRWLGITDPSACELIYLGLKHFRMPRETLRVIPAVFSDEQLRGMRVPTLLLMGEQEVIYDPANALARARGLIPDFQGELVPQSKHDMCFSQHRFVDARVLEFLKKTHADVQRKAAEQSVA